MRLDDRFLDELKSRLRLSDVIGRSVKLRRQGREWVGLSPFGREKTPSFYVNDEKGFFHDFSSGKHGDLIGFLQETERLSFREAVERLAGEAGLQLPTPDPRAAEQEARRQGLSDWLLEAQRWFAAQLRRLPGEAARRYLDRRALPADEWERFGLGYAPAGRTGLKDHLVAKGARPAELIEAGLLIAPEDGQAPYDRFRDRIIFPIADGRGRVVSFGGRALDPEARAKYLNGPESPLFHKGQVLYGLPEARRLLHAAETRAAAAARAGEASAPAALVVVEGYMDVIACQRADIPAVAPMGTALTEEQLAALWRISSTPALCFDADAAGRRAAERVIERAIPLLRPNRSLAFASLDGGKDPDDVLRESGKDALVTQLSSSMPLIDMLYKVLERSQEPLETPEQKARLKASLREVSARIVDGDLSEAYREALFARFQFRQDTERAQRRVQRFDRKITSLGYIDTKVKPETVSAARKLSLSPKPIVGAVGTALIRWPFLIDSRLEALVENKICDSDYDSLVQALIDLKFANEGASHEQALDVLGERRLLPRARALEWSAARSNWTLLREAPEPGVICDLWSQAYDVLLRATSFERSIERLMESMEEEVALERTPDFPTLQVLKAERDAVERAIASGTYTLDDAAETGGFVH